MSCLLICCSVIRANYIGNIRYTDIVLMRSWIWQLHVPQNFGFNDLTCYGCQWSSFLVHSDLTTFWFFMCLMVLAAQWFQPNIFWLYTLFWMCCCKIYLWELLILLYRYFIFVMPNFCLSKCLQELSFPLSLWSMNFFSWFLF